jgi:predicted GTPase
MSIAGEAGHHPTDFSQTSSGATEELDLQSLIELLDRAIQILQREPSCKEFFQEEIAWLEQRRAIWTNHAWRLALVGITSSGKSTLVNALMGERLLPTRIPPSSNVIILCRRGNEDQPVCKVRYQDGRDSLEVRGSRKIAEIIKNLGDEKYNRENQSRVEEIHLSSRDFPFAENFVLIDTPGLDAYGLERHEKLTLELLLPTVDLVMFLQTLKSNAHSELHRFLGVIRHHCKPLVFVQTSVDSVEDKLGLRGVVKKTKQEVRAEHKSSARKLLLEAGFSPETTPILQVSALKHSQGEVSTSGIIDLVSTVQQYTSSMIPELSRGRHRQLVTELARMADEHMDKGNPNESRREVDRGRRSILKLRKNAELIRPALEKEIDKVIASTRRKFHNLKSEAENLGRGEGDREAAQELLDGLRRFARESNDALGDTIRNWQKSLGKLGQRLNLRTEDLNCAKVPSRTVPSFHIPMSKKKVREPGIWGSVKRWFKWGGEHEVERLDPDKFRTNLEEAINEHLAWMQDEGKANILKSTAASTNAFSEELDRRTRSLERQDKTVLDRETRHRVACELRDLCSPESQPPEMLRDTPPVSEQSTVESFREEIEVSALTYSLVLTATRAAETRRLIIRNKALTLAARRAGAEAGKRCLLFGFDKESVERFLVSFWSDFPHGPSTINAALNEGIIDLGSRLPIESLALYCRKPNEPVVSRSMGFEDFLSRPATIFLFVDVEQIGSALNQIMRSGIRKSISRSTGLVLVIQCVRGLINARNLAEGVLYLRDAFDELSPKIVVDAVLANSNDILFTNASDVLFERGHKLQTLNDEQELVAALAANDPRARIRAGELLRGWRDYRNKGKE